MTRSSAYLFVFFFCLYGFTSSGTLGLDSAARLEVTRSLLAGKGFAAGGKGGVPGVWRGEPADYARYGIGQSILFIPFELAVVRPILWVVPMDLEDAARSVVMALTFFPFFGALSMVLLLRWLCDQGVAPRTALRYTLLCGLATPLFCYGSAPYEVTQFLALELLGLVVVGRAVAQGRGALLGLGVCLFCLPTFFKPTAAVDAVALLVWTLRWLKKQAGAGSERSFGFLAGHAVAAFGLIGVASLAWELYFNYCRFGDPFRTGYSLFFAKAGMAPFSNSYWKGFLGPLFSLDYGIVWYCPVLVGLAVAPVERLPEGLSDLFRVAIGWFFVLVESLACYVAFAGNYSYGPRYEIHLLPFLLLPLIPILHSQRIPRWLWVLAAASLAVQISWKSLSPRLEADQLCSEPDKVLFIEQTSLEWPGRWPQRFVNLVWKVSGTLPSRLEAHKGRELTYLEKTGTEWDYFWARGWKFGGSTGIALSVLAVGFAAVGLWSAARLRSTSKVPPPH